jgi:hypothetical protein
VWARTDCRPTEADDRENMARIQMTVIPAEAFAGAKQLIQRAIGDHWAELTRRIPELEG